MWPESVWRLSEAMSFLKERKERKLRMFSSFKWLVYFFNTQGLNRKLLHRLGLKCCCYNLALIFHKVTEITSNRFLKNNCQIEAKILPNLRPAGCFCWSCGLLCGPSAKKQMGEVSLVRQLLGCSLRESLLTFLTEKPQTSLEESTFWQKVLSKTLQVW